MEALSCILERRSIRRFKQEKLPDDLVKKIVGIVRFAPSWGNTKAVRYIFVSDDRVREKIAVCCTDHNRSIVEGAPHLFILTAVTGRSGMEGGELPADATHTPAEWLMFDSGAAAQTLCLAAGALGVGTVIMGGYDIGRTAELLPLPEDEKLIAVIAAGYPDEAPAAPRRKEVFEILRFI